MTGATSASPRVGRCSRPRTLRAAAATLDKKPQTKARQRRRYTAYRTVAVGSSVPLDTHARDRADRRHPDRGDNARAERNEIRETIGDRVHHDHGDSRSGNVLLEGQVAVDGHQRGEAGSAHRGQKFTVAETQPAFVAGGRHLNVRQCISEATRDAFVEQDPH